MTRLVNETDILLLLEAGEMTVVEVLGKGRSKRTPGRTLAHPDEPWNMSLRLAGHTLHAWAPGTTDVRDDMALMRIAASVNRLYRASSNHQKLHLESIVANCNNRF